MKLQGELEPKDVEDAIENYIRHRFKIAQNVQVKIEHKYSGRFEFTVKDPWEYEQEEEPITPAPPPQTPDTTRVTASDDEIQF